MLPAANSAWSVAKVQGSAYLIRSKEASEGEGRGGRGGRGGREGRGEGAKKERKRDRWRGGIEPEEAETRRDQTYCTCPRSGSSLRNTTRGGKEESIRMWIRSGGFHSMSMSDVRERYDIIAIRATPIIVVVPPVRRDEHV